MRPSTGTVAFTTAMTITILLIVGSALGLSLLLAMPGLADPLRSLPSNAWWFHYSDPSVAGSRDALWRICAAIAAACIACVAAFGGFRLYHKGSSPLLPFLMMFLFSLSLECLRAGTALLYASDRSIGLSIVLTRTIYWGRFMGLLALLIAGLYCIELKYRKVMVLAGGVFLVSFAMVAYIPMDRTVFLAQLTWKLGDEQSVWFVNLVIGILTVATGCAAALSRRDIRFLWLSAGFMLLLAAREFLFFATHPVMLAAGLACLAGGCLLCLRILSAIYQRAGEKLGI